MSHKHTEIEPAEGITLFAGSSFSGKSAIMDAIKWVAENKPVGDGFISYWARNEKGKQVEESYVTLELDDHVITRYRSATENKYVLDGNDLFSVGKGGPPDVILEALRFSEVNSQDQMEPLFLLNCSGGEVARILNKTVKLDLIDLMLSKVASFKRDNKKEVDLALSNVENTESKLEEYKFLDDAEKIIKKIEKLEASIIDTSELVADINDYEKAEEVLEQCAILSVAEKLIKKIEVLSAKEWDDIDLTEYEAQEKILEQCQIVPKAKDIISKLEVLRSKEWDEIDLTEYVKAEEIVRRCDIIPQADKTIKRISKYLEMLKDYDTASLERDVREYVVQDEFLSSYPEKMKELLAQMPSTCPACGKPLEECDE